MDRLAAETESMSICSWGKVVTSDDIRHIEDGKLNPLRDEEYSNNYRNLLQERRQLPVYKHRQQFLDVYQKSQVMVLTADTGAGKTTQIPQFVLWDEFPGSGRVVCTQPRRLAATSVASRVADELDVKLGKEVDYAVRFDTVEDHPDMRLKYVTGGILLQYFLSDSKLQRYSCIIVDEAHERTVDTDMVLALLKNLTKERKDLKVIIMSATMDSNKFSAYFDNAPHFHIPGRSYPVDTYYLEKATSSYFDACISYVRHIHQNLLKGDIIVFLTGEEEVERACTTIRHVTKDLNVLSLYSNLPFGRQQKIFKPSTVRKCICATNIAETSLTIPGVRYVIDPGVAKEKVYNPRVRMEILQAGPISKASADQRLGRAGRTQPGKCFRMYTKQAFDEIFPVSTKPAILRSETKSTILLLNYLGFDDVLSFNFIDPPDPELYLSGLEDLYHLGFIDETARITTLGREAARFPIDPAWYLAIREAERLNCSWEILSITTLMSVQQSIFVRPRSVRHVADLARAQFGHPSSDHLTYLNALNAYMRMKKEETKKEEATKGAGLDPKKWCMDHFLSYGILEEVLRIREQLARMLGKYGYDFTSAAFGTPDYEIKIRKALALSFFHQAAIKVSGEGTCKTIHHDVPALIHWDSMLAEGDIEWIVYNRFTFTGGKQYIQTITAIEPEWIMDLPFFQNMPERLDGLFKQPDVKKSLDKARAKVKDSASETQERGSVSDVDI